MDERGYLAQAFLDRLQDEGVAFSPLGEAGIAVAPRALAQMPRQIARFCQDFDLQLVQLFAPRRRTWQCVLAWHDEFGHPRFLPLTIVGDEDLLAARPDLHFDFGMRDAVEHLLLDEQRGDWLATLWAADPRGAIEQIRRAWRGPRDIRLVAQAAKHRDWRGVRAELPRLRRTMRPLLANALARAEACVRRAIAPAASRVQLSPSMSAAALKELACRVEQRYPEALVGENPLASRLLQKRLFSRVLQPFLGCDIRCPLPSPVLMPYPYGIVINRGSAIGSRVTLMHQVTIFDAVIEDNVTIGPGAKIIGPLRVGRGARIGANAVVSEDVPSHSTENVAPRRQEKIETVVNM
jgi:serine acetyltransferase